MEIQRAPFSPELKGLRQTLRQELLPILQAQPDWYASIFFERKASKTYSANLKQTQVTDQVIQGAVLRIYDGTTLFEQATDELDPGALKSFALEFARRVKETAPPAGATRRPYQALNWSQRVAAAKLDPELLIQIPSGTRADTQVHFGIRFRHDPRLLGASEALERLKGLLGRIKAKASEIGFPQEDLTFITARQTFVDEQSIFIDRETDMSQTLYRVALTLITMSGSDRTFARLGGLGGLETLEVKESDIETLLRDLKGLKKAERLVPGKYPVIFGPVPTGVLAHEAFGHSQEGDTCARGRSKAWELHQSGEKVGNEHATILNNPAIYEMAGEPYAAWGSYFFDEEGWLAHEQVLLERGVLKTPMTNLTSAIRLGVPRTANGKRENWSTGVYTRQTNTYFSPGDQTLAQLLARMKDGFIALHPAGGMEDPKGMGIQVGLSFLEEVRNGKPTGRLFKGPAGGDIQLTGYTPDVLNSIVAKSKIDADTDAPDRSRHPFNDAGGCGKYHKEFVFAGCGGPYLLLDQVILG
ncbi:MAG: TldD/PmbA family protein [Oligoflexia bacterium]|nr:TldD/PmbA family protein [Oligoflexia bacterium]